MCGRRGAGRSPGECQRRKRWRERAREGGEGESSAESSTFPQSGDLTHGSHTFHSLWPVGPEPVLSVRSTAWRRRGEERGKGGGKGTCVYVCVCLEGWCSALGTRTGVEKWREGCVCNPRCALNPLSSRVSVQVCAGVSERIFRPAEVDRVCLVCRRETIAVLFICTERKRVQM